MATHSVFLPGESQGRGSLVGCRLWDHTESDMTEATEQQQQHWLNNKESACNAADAGDVGSILGREDSQHWKWQLTPISLPRKPGGQRSLTGYSPWSDQWLDVD